MPHRHSSTFSFPALSRTIMTDLLTGVAFASCFFSWEAAGAALLDGPRQLLPTGASNYQPAGVDVLEGHRGSLEMLWLFRN